MDAVERTKYDAIAYQYSNSIDGKSWNKLYERPYLTSLLQDIKGKNILDAACGSGFFTQYCLEKGANVTALDASEKMLEITRQRIAPHIINTYTADLSKPLEFIGPASQDIIISSLTLHYIEDLSIPLSEFYRILKKNGIVLISMHHPFCDYLQLKKESYFSSEFVEDSWHGFGQPLKVIYYTRPMGELLKYFLESSFKITHIDEPLPGELCKQEAPEAYIRLTTRPAFLFIRLVKE